VALVVVVITVLFMLSVLKLSICLNSDLSFFVRLPMIVFLVCLSVCACVCDKVRFHDMSQTAREILPHFNSVTIGDRVELIRLSK